MRVIIKPFMFAPVGVTTMLLTASFMPGIASATALKTPLVRTGAAAVSTGPFCSNLQSKATGQGNRMGTLETELGAAQSKHLSTLQGNWSSFSTKLTGLQSQWQTDRNNEYARLTSLATTDAEKSAVTTFETTVNNAISARESANATARTTYQGAITAAAATESASITAAESALQSAASGAVATAEASCQTGTSSAATIQATLTSAINSAKQTFQSSVQSTRTTFKAAVTAAQTTEQSTITQNDATFQSAVSAAVTALKSAFGQS